LGSRLRWIAAALLAAAAIVAAILVMAQSPFPLSTFEFQQYRDFKGTLAAEPYPRLLVDRPGAPSASSYLLVAPGKHGAAPLVAGLAGHTVDLKGSLIYRDGFTLMEVVPDSLKPGTARHVAEASQDLGTIALDGEIVDSKCYFGVMNPGNGHVHLDCAVQCIRGGIPPVLVVKTAQETRHLLVKGDVLPFVGRPVHVEGAVQRMGDLPTITARSIAPR
jgi:hypothetical protein